ncbi:phage adsorption protein NrfB [Wenzhouxiangella sp. AB-CW3]|uniref:glycosyl transferase family protein n=1 Tax=Wenzhouxiangella sp. AB-CW3 TaxID=2771012 RepID=UPI00168AAC1A|nr:glycosyl transferase family protein [Wenzhouxiangella sp. AB-CW3]QOC23753.1 phage adsorption protein NrfB [Wenzhouxiangella sp. AB-CW3]
MDWVDLTAVYLYGLKYVTIVTAILLAFLSLDDLFVDIVYWCRRFWRNLTIYRQHRRAGPDSLLTARQRPLVIMVPAWQESEVIARMVEAAGRSIDYENYHIVVGTYPNDTETQQAVDQIADRHPTVHKVVCARPGPTSKADCLNNIVVRVFELEEQLGVQFEGFILHDAEDVIPSLELRVFNAMLAGKDLIQVPVYPLPRPLHKFTGGHYVDEFAEQHGKDVVIREALAGQVPSAGVGTCFSRRALLSLMREHDSVPFDTQSLTEDYDIAVRLARRGMKEVFVRFPSERLPDGQSLDATVVAVREYFPEKFSAAVRQKSRWVTGIVFQGASSLRWGGSFWMNYFLWRDRRGLIAHPVSFLATFILFNALVLLLYGWLSDDPYRFLGMFAESQLLVTLLWINGFLLLNRLLQRIYFVSAQYGIVQGLMSAPRMLWSNVINFAATGRAAWLYARATQRKGMDWDKTAHEFPELGKTVHIGALGATAVAEGMLSDEALDRALTERRPEERLGETLLRLELISPRQLCALLAAQAGVPCRDFDPRNISRAQLELMDLNLARKYGVFPLQKEPDGALLLARETALLPVQQRALTRRLGRDVRYVITPQGTVTTALRLHCSGRPMENPIKLLEAAVESEQINARQAETLWMRYIHRQVLLGDLLMGNHVMSSSALYQALLGYEESDLPLGQYLVEHGYLSQSALESTLELQQKFQPTMRQLLEESGIDPESLEKEVVS